METPGNLTKVFISLSKHAKDISGQRFGRLVALGPVGRSKHQHIEWLCQCDCGERVVAQSNYLSFGTITSCGCHFADEGKRRPEQHGLSSSPIYEGWVQMCHRCHSENNSNYHNYGARGIQVCNEWRESFAAFESYVTQLSHYGEAGRTLDRIDNDGKYEPGNVRWATSSEQHRNRRNNRMLTHNGKTQCLPAWAEELGINPNVIEVRLSRGFTTEQALSTQLGKHRINTPSSRTLTHNGKTQRLSAWAKELGTSHATLINRLNSGWSVERTLSTPVNHPSR